jgi:hypothetical protein
VGAGARGDVFRGGHGIAAVAADGDAPLVVETRVAGVDATQVLPPHGIGVELEVRAVVPEKHAPVPRRENRVGPRATHLHVGRIETQFQPEVFTHGAQVPPPVPQTRGQELIALALQREALGHVAARARATARPEIGTERVVAMSWFPTLWRGCAKNKRRASSATLSAAPEGRLPPRYGVDGLCQLLLCMIF